MWLPSSPPVVVHPLFFWQTAALELLQWGGNFSMHTWWVLWSISLSLSLKVYPLFLIPPWTQLESLVLESRIHTHTHTYTHSASQYLDEASWLPVGRETMSLSGHRRTSHVWLTSPCVLNMHPGIRPIQKSHTHVHSHTFTGQLLPVTQP